MPSLPGRSCSTPGCSGSVTRSSYCAACRIFRQKLFDSHRLSPIERGYDGAHRRLRLLAFERDGWTCVDCGWQPSVVKQCHEVGLPMPPQDVILDELRLAKNRKERHLHADHQIPIEQRPDLRLDLNNYRTRCSVCHSAKTMRELKGCVSVSQQ